jgi:branched-chain amino acid transport system ATP-binding protein
MSPLLETRNVSKSYGVFSALENVSMAVGDGELVSVVGPNGAGKTTLVNLLTGLLSPTSGEVFFMGRNIAGVGPVALADQGLARAFQLIQIFPKLTVGQTIAAAVVSRQKKRWRLLSRLSEDSEIHDRVEQSDRHSCCCAFAGREKVA